MLHFKCCVCPAFSRTAQPRVLQARLASAPPHDAFSWTLHQKTQRYALIYILRGEKKKQPPFP